MANGESMGGSSAPINEVALTKVCELIQECQPGSMVTRFVLLVETIDAEDQDCYFSGFTAPGQKRWQSLGLLEYGSTVERNIAVDIADDDE